MSPERDAALTMSLNLALSYRSDFCLWDSLLCFKPLGLWSFSGWAEEAEAREKEASWPGPVAGGA